MKQAKLFVPAAVLATSLACGPVYPNPRYSDTGPASSASDGDATTSSAHSNKVRVKMPDSATAPSGGTCVSCFDDHGMYLELTTTWTRYDIYFSQLAQDGWGDPLRPALDVTQIYSLDWAADTDAAAFDFSVDQVGLISEDGSIMLLDDLESSRPHTSFGTLLLPEGAGFDGFWEIASDDSTRTEPPSDFTLEPFEDGANESAYSMRYSGKNLTDYAVIALDFRFFDKPNFDPVESPRVPVDLSAYLGVSFWAKAGPGR